MVETAKLEELSGYSACDVGRPCLVQSYNIVSDTLIQNLL